MGQQSKGTPFPITADPAIPTGEKEARTVALQKLDPLIVLALRQSRGKPPFDQLTAMQPGLEIGSDGRVRVDLEATVSKELLERIRSLGGEVIDSFAPARVVRAIVPLAQLETLAGLDEVAFISPPAKDGQPAPAAREPRATGLRPPTPEERAYMDQTMTKTVDVRPNRLGLERINADRARQGLPPLPIEPVPDGQESVPRAPP
ncbi:MAG: hypothetical protein ABUL68_05320 [Pseudomonadota bacterium]